MTSENDKKIIWKIEKTHPVETETLKSAFREITDPELGLSIMELGLIRDVAINDGIIEINMILTTPFCPYGPALLEMARQKAENTLNLPAKIEMGLEMWDFSMMEEGAGADWKLY
ncbi:MAG: iron-sulfur cluster assembly protein [Chloroflexi bacterium]|nr:iron-sulfur cluster assembly protein [Chloroflexota bacterium]